MSIPNEALQKVCISILHYIPPPAILPCFSRHPCSATNDAQLMQDIESKAAFSQQQLQIVREQMALKAREIRVSQLTAQELTKVPQETKTYESVGKM